MTMQINWSHPFTIAWFFNRKSECPEIPQESHAADLTFQTSQQTFRLCQKGDHNISRVDLRIECFEQPRGTVEELNIYRVWYFKTKAKAKYRNQGWLNHQRVRSDLFDIMGTFSTTLHLHINIGQFKMPLKFFCGRVINDSDGNWDHQDVGLSTEVTKPIDRLMGGWIKECILNIKM